MQDAITIVSLIVAGISGIAGILWSNQYKEAKQAQLDVKDEQIKLWKELAPQKIKEAYDSMKSMLEERIEYLEETRDELERTVEDLETNNSSLTSDLENAQKTVKELKHQLESMTDAVWKVANAARIDALNNIIDKSVSFQHNQQRNIAKLKFQIERIKSDPKWGNRINTVFNEIKENSSVVEINNDCDGPEEEPSTDLE